MIYQLRIFKDHPGRVEAHLQRFRDHTNRLLEKHGAKVVGCWTSADGSHEDEVVYMLAYPDLEAMRAGGAAFAADPDQHSMYTDSEKDGPIILSRENWVLRPADFSPLQ